MAGKSSLKASEDQKQGLEGLAASRDRGEADRARTMLLTLGGRTSRRIAAAFGMHENTVRPWRSDFMGGGVAALKAHGAPAKTEEALRAVTPLREAPVACRQTGRSRVLSPRSRRARASR